MTATAQSASVEQCKIAIQAGEESCKTPFDYKKTPPVPGNQIATYQDQIADAIINRTRSEIRAKNCEKEINYCEYSCPPVTAIRSGFNNGSHVQNQRVSPCREALQQYVDGFHQTTLSLDTQITQYQGLLTAISPPTATAALPATTPTTTPPPEPTAADETSSSYWDNSSGFNNR